MTPQSLFNNLSPKEEALYRSVLSLMKEGQPLATMKVSDIAKGAGIGKGTTYEYVTSKEELIGKAMLYGACQAIEELRRRVQKANGFEHVFMKTLDWIDENLTEHQSLYQILCLDGTQYEMPIEARKAVKQNINGLDFLKEELDTLAQQAIDEGALPQSANKDLVSILFVDMMITYIMYRTHPVAGVDKDEMRKFLYGTLINAFSK